MSRYREMTNPEFIKYINKSNLSQSDFENIHTVLGNDYTNIVREIMNKIDQKQDITTKQGELQREYQQRFIKISDNENYNHETIEPENNEELNKHEIDSAISQESEESLDSENSDSTTITYEISKKIFKDTKDDKKTKTKNKHLHFNI